MEVDPGTSYGSACLVDTSDKSDPSSQNGSFPLPPPDMDFFFDEIPSFDTLIGDLDFGSGENFDCDFSFDDICSPSDGKDILAGPYSDPLQGPDPKGSSEHRGLTHNSRESDSSNLGHEFPQDLSDRCCNISHSLGSDQFVDDVLNSQSQESVCCDRESSDRESFPGSGNCGSGGSEDLNLPPKPHDSRSPDDPGSVPSSPDFELKSSPVAGVQKVKLEGTGRNIESKRKQGNPEGNDEMRTSKFRRSTALENSNSHVFNAANGVDEKRKARMMRNRESAQLSRQRKRLLVEELENKLRRMHSTVQDLNSKIYFLINENASLKQQIISAGISPAPPPGTYPHPAMAPMAYPWVPCAPYVVKSQGSQVPLVPIPRLKPQQSAGKAKMTVVKKSEGKIKKLAGLSFLGLLFFIMLVGGLFHMVGDKVEPSYGSDYASNDFYAPYQGRFFIANGTKQAEGDLCHGKPDYKKDFSSRIKFEIGHVGEPKQGDQASKTGRDGHDPVGNASKPLAASLYVPRNDELVKIDGNLIIHSVMASENAMASQDRKETGLAIARKVSSALAISDGGMINGRHPYVYSSPEAQKKALTSGSADDFQDRSSTADGKMQQWFREDLEGPMLSSGTCTEVFQFEASVGSAPGGMISASSVTNMTAEHRPNSTYVKRGRNRRALRGFSIPLPESNNNSTGQNEQAWPEGGNKTGEIGSSMVVSVLIDPREVGDSRPKSLSRIFVVVLLDSVKYVTYSCVLPLKGSGPHLVAK